MDLALLKLKTISIQCEIGAFQTTQKSTAGIGKRLEHDFEKRSTAKWALNYDEE